MPRRRKTFTRFPPSNLKRKPQDKFAFFGKKSNTGQFEIFKVGEFNIRRGK